MLELTDKTFLKTVHEKKAVLVDFWAPWCGPCLSMAPELEKAAEELGDSVLVCKFNIDDNEKTAIELEIQAVPTLLMFKDGALVDEHIGVLSKTKIVALAKKHL